MPGFKDYAALDRAVFINVDEFGELHAVNGQQLTIVVDNDQLQQRSKSEYEGVAVGDILYYAKTEDFVEMPKVDDVQKFDGWLCIVFDVREDAGILEIILKRNVN